MHKVYHYFQQQSLQKKLLVVMLTVNLAFIHIILGLMLWYQYSSYRYYLNIYAREQSELMASNVGAAMLFDDKSNTEEILQALRFSPFVVQADVFDNAQKFYARFQRSPLKNSTDTLLQKTSDVNYLFAHSQIVVKGDYVGDIYVKLSLNGLYQALFWFVGATMLASLAGILVTIKLARKLNNAITQPLFDLTALMQTLGNSQNYQLRSPLRSKDEIGQLAQGFNTLLDQIVRHEAQIQSELQQRQLAEQRFERLANFDSVTHMANRHAFNTSLKNVVEANSKQKIVGLMFVDLDNFKTVNDTLGHHAGDLLLKAVAERIQGAVADHGQAFRIGGDEFAVILPEASTFEMQEIAQSIIQALNQPCHIQQNSLHIGASIGISIYPEHADNMQTLMRRADEAMYHAKSLNKNNFQFFDQKMVGKIERRIHIEKDLKEAIRLKQLQVYYQPIVNIHSLKVIGLEALVRWQHPQLGVISPSEFIQIAEESGLIVPLGEWVMQTACLQMLVWHRQFHHAARLAVNVSAKQFMGKYLIDTLQKILTFTGFPPHCLELELTESTLINDIELAITQMHRIRQLGVRISVDDFGMGFSSLSYLNKLPLNTLKIDKSFVQGLPDHQENIAITRAILSMANELSFDVIVEGIEKDTQLAYLQLQAKCAGQGYLFSPPLSAKELEEKWMVSYEETIMQFTEESS